MPRSVRLYIEGSPLVRHELLGNAGEAAIGDHARVKVTRQLERKHLDATAMMEFVLTFEPQVVEASKAVVAAWLWDKLRTAGARRVEIDGHPMPDSEEGVLDILREAQ